MSKEILVALLVFLSSQEMASQERMFGFNYPDAALKFTIQGKVGKQLAQKAIIDASLSGADILRVFISGFGASDLKLWFNPATRDNYWRTIEEFRDTLAKNNLRVVISFIWDPALFPKQTGETVAEFIRDEGSASRRLFYQYYQELIARFKDARTADGKSLVPFWEMGNELDLSADQNIREQCLKNHNERWCVAEGDFTTQQLLIFSRDFVRFVRSIDSKPPRPISSGFALSKKCAEHLRLNPATPVQQGDWTEDTKEEFLNYFRLVNEQFDMISVHLYEGDAARFGFTGTEIIDWLWQLADGKGKRLYIGESGSPNLQGHNFELQVLDKAKQLNVPITLWAWQFYQAPPFSKPDMFNLEPGFTPDIVNWYIRNNRRLQNETGPPRLVITEPLPGTVIKKPDSKAYVTASSNDRNKGLGVKSVRFLLDNGPLYTAGGAEMILVQPPFSFLWQDIAPRPGKHNLIAIVETWNGETATTSADFTVTDTVYNAWITRDFMKEKNDPVEP